MSRLLKTGFFLALVLVFAAGRAADAAFTEEEVLRRRLDRMERELSQLRRQMERGDPAAGVDRTQLSQMVKEELENIQGPETFHVYWKEGLRLKTMDEAFSLRIGGRVMVDWAWMDEDDELTKEFGEFEDGIEFRRARMYMQGDIYENTGYKLQLDFAGGEVALKDAYLEFLNLLPFAELKVGHFKEPFSLEELTSSKYITFMERALPVSLAPSRNTGFQLSGDLLDDRMTWAGGIFWDADGTGDANMEDGAALTGRLTYLPWYEDDGAKLLHLGAAGSYRSPDMVELEIRPEIHQAEKLLTTMEFMTDSAWQGGLEAALVHGPFSVQAEAITTGIDREDHGDLDLSGFYVFGSYFLTGEHRAYKGGSFSRVKPINNFDGKGNWGAWEVAARYSYLELEDDDYGDQELDGITAGLNWYLNPNMRVMWNYVLSGYEADDEDIDGDVQAFMMRFQVDF